MHYFYIVCDLKMSFYSVKRVATVGLNITFQNYKNAITAEYKKI